MEGYFERVVETLTGAGYRWYETANFCLRPEVAGGRDLRARHNLGYWLGARLPRPRGRRGLDDRGRRWRNAPGAARATSAALGRGERPPRELEPLAGDGARAGSGCCSGCGWTSRWRSAT